MSPFSLVHINMYNRMDLKTQHLTKTIASMQHYPDRISLRAGEEAQKCDRCIQTLHFLPGLFR